MECVAEARDGRTKDVKVFRAHLRYQLLHPVQDPPGRGWRLLIYPSSSGFVRYEAWQSSGETKPHDFRSEGLQTAGTVCRFHSLAHRIALFQMLLLPSLLHLCIVDWVQQAMPMMPDCDGLRESALSPLDQVLSFPVGMSQPITETCAVRVADFCGW